MLGCTKCEIERLYMHRDAHTHTHLYICMYIYIYKYLSIYLSIYIYICILKIYTWYPKQQFFNGCFTWMIPSLYLGNGCFTKQLVLKIHVSGQIIIFHQPRFP